MNGGMTVPRLRVPDGADDAANSLWRNVYAATKGGNQQVLVSAARLLRSGTLIESGVIRLVGDCPDALYPAAALAASAAATWHRARTVPQPGTGSVGDAARRLRSVQPQTADRLIAAAVAAVSSQDADQIRVLLARLLAVIPQPLSWKTLCIDLAAALTGSGQAVGFGWARDYNTYPARPAAGSDHSPAAAAPVADDNNDPVEV